MNRVLARQLRRLGLSESDPPADPADWSALLDAVEAAYGDGDRARYLLERSLEISTREMQELTEEISALSEHREKLAKHNFNELPVAAWLEDFRSVVERLEELRGQGVEDLHSHLEANPDELRSLVERVVVLDVNPAVSELVGAARPDLLGSVPAGDIGEESLRSWERQFQALWDGEGRVEVEFTGERVDGSEFAAYLQWSVAHIAGDFDYSRVMVVVIDISDRIAAEERMREMVKAKDEFLASVSHELRTPLTSVVGYADLLGTLLDGPDDVREMIDTIASQASDLANIVEDLLVGARAELGQLKVESQPLDLPPIVDSVVVAYPQVAWEGAPDGLPKAAGDSARVRQILRNLITNAERYGGPDVRITMGSVDGNVLVAVCDDGSPLPHNVQDRIFDRYYREKRVAGRPGSVGIGLTISRDLARMMGGDLTYSHDGATARFELTLPVAADESSVLSLQASGGEVSAGG